MEKIYYLFIGLSFCFYGLGDNRRKNEIFAFWGEEENCIILIGINQLVGSNGLIFVIYNDDIVRRGGGFGKTLKRYRGKW